MPITSASLGIEDRVASPLQRPPPIARQSRMNKDKLDRKKASYHKVTSPKPRVPLGNLSLMEGDHSFAMKAPTMTSTLTQMFTRKENDSRQVLEPIDELRVSSASPGPESARRVVGDGHARLHSRTLANSNTVLENGHGSFGLHIGGLHETSGSPEPTDGQQNEESKYVVENNEATDTMVGTHINEAESSDVEDDDDASVMDELRQLTNSAGFEDSYATTNELEELHASAASPGPGSPRVQRQTNAKRSEKMSEVAFPSEVIDEIRQLTTSPVRRTQNQATSHTSVYDDLRASAASPPPPATITASDDDERFPMPGRYPRRRRRPITRCPTHTPDSDVDVSDDSSAVEELRDLTSLHARKHEKRSDHASALVFSHSHLDDLHASAASPGPAGPATSTSEHTPSANITRGVRHHPRPVARVRSLTPDIDADGRAATAAELRRLASAASTVRVKRLEAPSSVRTHDSAHLEDRHASAASPGPENYANVSSTVQQTHDAGVFSNDIIEEIRELAASPPPQGTYRSTSPIYDELHASAASPGPSTGARYRRNVQTKVNSYIAHNRSSSISEELQQLTSGFQSDDSGPDGDLRALQCASPGPGHYQTLNESVDATERKSHKRSSVDEELRSLASTSTKQSRGSSQYDELHASAASPGPAEQARRGTKPRSVVPQRRRSSVAEELRSVLTSPLENRRSTSVYDELRASAASPGPQPAEHCSAAVRVSATAPRGPQLIARRSATNVDKTSATDAPARRRSSSITEELNALSRSQSKARADASIYDELHALAASPGEYVLLNRHIIARVYLLLLTFGPEIFLFLSRGCDFVSQGTSQ